MVILLDPKAALTPAGRPVARAIPVAPVVLCMTNPMVVLMQVTDDAGDCGEAVLGGNTVTVTFLLHVPVPEVIVNV